MNVKDAASEENQRLLVPKSNVKLHVSNDSNQKASSSAVGLVEEQASSAKKDVVKSGAKSQRTGGASRGTATKRSKPFEPNMPADLTDKQSGKKQSGESANEIVAQSTTKKRVQKANRKDSMAQQSTPSKKNRSRTAHKGSPGQRGKMEDYDHTFDRPDDLNKTTA